MYLYYSYQALQQTQPPQIYLWFIKKCLYILLENSLEDFVITPKLVDTLKANVGYPLVSKDTIQEELHGWQVV